MKVYMMVTRDKYELPVRIADTVPELAELTGHSENSIRSQISKYIHKGMLTRFRSVEIGDEEEL